MTFFETLQPLLIDVALLAIPLVGGMVTAFAKSHFSAKATQTITDTYNAATEVMAGWLAARKDALQSVTTTAGDVVTASIPALTPDHPDVQAAVQQMKKSFPKAIADTGSSDNIVANDIIGSFGKLFGTAIAGPVGGLVAGVAVDALTHGKK